MVFISSKFSNYGMLLPNALIHTVKKVESSFVAKQPDFCAVPLTPAIEQLKQPEVLPEEYKPYDLFSFLIESFDAEIIKKLNAFEKGSLKK